MSILSSKFDIQSVETPLAVAALAQTLDVASGPASGLYTGAGTANDFSGGTPLTGSTVINPGNIVAMDNTGKAVLADAPVIWKHAASDTDVTAGYVLDGSVNPVLPFVALDGNTDYSGKFVRRITVVHGGITFVTDQFDETAGTLDIGAPVTFAAGKIVPKKGAHAGKQTLGFVGPLGKIAADGVVQVLMPQGMGA